MKKRNNILLIILIIMVVLLLPLIFKDKGDTSFNAPELSELEYSEIYFNNDSANLKLSGMLMLPEGEEPFPTAIIIQGSGPSYRTNGWYLSVIKYLQDNGIAVLIPDKRGCEKSEGEWIGASFEDLASDAVSAIEYVKAQDKFKYMYIGLIGMSQGGWITPLTATKTEDVSYIANISGATVTTDEQLVYEETNNLAPYTYKFIAKLIAPITAENIKKKEFFAPLVGFDPIPYWKNIEIPVFFGFGENDQNVPIGQCIERLRENDLNNFMIKTYPNGGHGIIDAKAKIMNQEYLNDLVKFIKDVNH
jgi:uncharacterized protein